MVDEMCYSNYKFRTKKLYAFVCSFILWLERFHGLDINIFHNNISAWFNKLYYLLTVRPIKHLK